MSARRRLTSRNNYKVAKGRSLAISARISAGNWSIVEELAWNKVAGKQTLDVPQATTIQFMTSSPRAIDYRWPQINHPGFSGSSRRIIVFP